MFNFNFYNPRNTKVLLKKFLTEYYRQARNFVNRFKILILRQSPKIKLRMRLGILGALALSFLYFSLLAPPGDFPVGSIVTIGEGETLKQIADGLENKQVIKSAAVFSGLAKVLMKGKGVMAGDYFFEQKSSVVRIVWKTVRGDYGITPIRITFVEGLTVYEMAEIMEKKFPEFDADEFLKIAQEEEGFLFPDTYYFLPGVTPQALVSAMKENFHEKIQEISQKIEDCGRTLEDIVTMASLLEKEARTLKSKQIISGILWKRLDIDMPLQVDASFSYVNGKNTYQLSLEDLKIDSPYNTYKHKGLPAGPIANPSLWSLLAAVTPVDSNYLFYLSDRRGNMYYAADFEEHKRNKRLYMHLY